MMRMIKRFLTRKKKRTPNREESFSEDDLFEHAWTQLERFMRPMQRDVGNNVTLQAMLAYVAKQCALRPNAKEELGKAVDMLAEHFFPVAVEHISECKECQQDALFLRIKTGVM